MMSLNECIDHVEEQSKWMSKYAMIDIYKDRSEYYQQYYQQLAEWLRELKEYREFADWLVEAVLEEDWEDNSDFYAEVLCRKLTKLGKLKVVDNKYMEVNADDT